MHRLRTASHSGKVSDSRRYLREVGTYSHSHEKRRLARAQENASDRYLAVLRRYCAGREAARLAHMKRISYFWPVSAQKANVTRQADGCQRASTVPSGRDAALSIRGYLQHGARRYPPYPHAGVRGGNWRMLAGRVLPEGGDRWADVAVIGSEVAVPAVNRGRSPGWDAPFHSADAASSCNDTGAIASKTPSRRINA